ncbi:MAG: alcohol dehydrogenase catalytic domain-containing protein [Silvibacterium sp.]|nr:alcohol dehydrogenase catalytic domain-containing protein [Silvibacterium sp.]MBV8436626.1 alcohol dehydrogenase catalytic domain-containing protein [Silvibacterium sp.]
MTAAVLYGREDVRIERLPIPTAGLGEIVVRVQAALTCGTDLKVYRRGYHARMLTVPMAFGHELSGIVHETGPGVRNFHAGDRVVALNSAPCDECYFCRRGQQNLCDDLLFNNGAYAEFISIPARIVEKNTLLVPDHIPFEHAALTEPLACVVRGLEETTAQPGDSIVVIGGGPIGLMFMHVAQLAGLHVIAVVKRSRQIAAARTFGAEHVIQITSAADPIAAVRALTPSHRGVDIAIEAVATPTTWQWAVDMVRKGGTVNFFGGCAAGTRVDLDTNRLHYNDITLKASFHHTPATARRAFELIRSGKFKCREYITGRSPLSELDSVLRRLMNRSSDIKTAIIP